MNAPHVPTGYLPQTSIVPDAGTGLALSPDPAPKMDPPSPPPLQPPGKGPVAFELPPGLPGAQGPRVRPPKIDPKTPPAERLRLVREAYPELLPLTRFEPPPGPVLALGDLQEMARQSSPVLRKAEADAGVAYGLMIQAGLPPNPTVGYQADQWQPGTNTAADPRKHNAGQQGGFVNQLIKFPGKLSLAQAVARFDYINAYVAVRRAEVDVATAVRTAYFQVLAAEKGIAVSTALATMADEVYRLQLRQVAAGEAAAYEPLQLYAQAVQARNLLAQAMANHRASWGRLAAALGRPELPLAPLAGSIDRPPPVIDPAMARNRIVEAHTDILTTRNRILQAETNLRLQKLNRAPDLSTNSVVQYDHAGKNPQFNLQLGVPLPLWNRNQGNIQAAEYQIASQSLALSATQNDLLSRLAEALSRYEANRVAVANYRDRVLPALTQAYQGLIRRFQQEPLDLPGGKVGFNDIVTAQQNLAQALQSYLTALSAQWQAAVDIGALLQIDELYSGPPPSK
jgi:cobalt-zinc-cadmium efflux system outer membrane protein